MIEQEVDKLRTFAIISHPDAGKTTITEKLLLFGKAIQLAGTVKSKKSDRYAASDWMEMERDFLESLNSQATHLSSTGHL